MNMIDLHVHSNKSDGTFSPSALVDYAMEKGLSAFALTDHDTVEGLDEALERARELRETVNPNSNTKIPEVISGIELSTEYEGQDIHILGLSIDHKNPEFKARLQEFIDSRTLRNHKMCALLQEHGIPITYQALTDAYPDSVITRAHYGQWMLDHGYVKSMKEAFDRYIGDQAPCFIPREKITPAQAVELILTADGIPVLAHPTLYHMSNARLDKLVSQLKEAGLLALEAIYTTNSPSEEREMRRLAAKYNLLLSGGSDFHGLTKPEVDLTTGHGRLFIPKEIWDNLKKSRRYALFSDLDDTLLRSDKSISSAMHQGIFAYADQGNYFILNTGRPLSSVIKVREKLQLDHPGCRYAIAYNGALIYDFETCTYLSDLRLSPDDVDRITQICDQWGLHIQAYDDEYLLARRPGPELDYYTARTMMQVRYVEDLADAIPKGPNKMLCISLDNHQKLEELRSHIDSLMGDRITSLFSNDKYLEFLPADAGKGKALVYLRDYLHLPASHTYAAGDQENDLTMIEAAGWGVAVANAIEPVKAAARIVTEKDCDHDGLLEVLEMLTGKD
ncbi:MAG: Cof-type HAD-IIB family hydrolase [Lachnospiraceae bacterium]|nr:Cof-type HAD-IIB family hydrolase [Lachnospiraceae bacterium]